MNLGLAIFLSAIFLGGIWLYYITKDRWNWNKIWLKTAKYLGLVILLIVVIGGIVQLVKYIQSKNSSAENLQKAGEIYIEDLEKTLVERFIPTKAEMFWDVSLGTNKNDLVFYKETPTKKLSNKIWLYEWEKKLKLIHTFRIMKLQQF
jgi:hypothetical protein